MSDRAVFIVDGHEAFRRAAAEVVAETSGFRLVGTAEASAPALAAARAGVGPIDLLVVDVYLPDGDGASLATELRRHLPDLAVLFTSALRLDDLPIDLLGESGVGGCSAVVAKATFDADALTTGGRSAATVFYPERDGRTAGRRT